MTKIGEVSVALFRGAKNLAAIEAVGCIYCGLIWNSKIAFLVK